MANKKAPANGTSVLAPLARLTAPFPPHVVTGPAPYNPPANPRKKN